MLGILHGSWSYKSFKEGSFFIWIEKLLEQKEVPAKNSKTKKQKKTSKKSKNKSNDPTQHPFIVEGSKLIDYYHKLLDSLENNNKFASDLRIDKIDLMLPSKSNLPMPSPDLVNLAKWISEKESFYNSESLDYLLINWWQIDILIIPTDKLLNFFSLLNFNSADIRYPVLIGQDLKFWINSYLLYSSLFDSGCFIPNFNIEQPNVISPYWEIIPFVDQFEVYWSNLLDNMPSICTSYRTPSQRQAKPIPSSVIMISFFNTLLNNQLTGIISDLKLEKPLLKLNRGGKRIPKSLAKNWLSGLILSDKIEVEESSIQYINSMKNFLNAGIESLESIEEMVTDVCFQLEPPESQDSTVKNWKISFWLQSKSDPSFRIPASDIWNEKSNSLKILRKEVKNPQEVLLEGLGKAIKIFPQLRSALKTAEPEAVYLDTKEAINYIQLTSLQLQSSGYISLIPKGESKKNIKNPSINLQLSPISQGIISQNNILSFDWKIAIGDTILSDEDIEVLISAKESLIYLRGNWVQVNQKEIENTISFFKRLEENGTGGLDLSLAIKLKSKSIVDNGLSITQVKGPEWFDELFSENKKFELLTPPESLNAKLRPYQIKGYSWLVFMHSIGLNPCLADDMGLGKTIQCISLILYHLNKLELPSLNKINIESKKTKTSKKRKSSEYKGGYTLIVCPTSVMTNWGKELSKFAPSLNWVTYHGKDRNSLLKNPINILITSYGLIRRDIEVLSKLKFHLIVIDESQYIKNPLSGQSKAIRSLNATHKIALTGTPIENRLSELWSLFDFLHPSYIGNLNQFLRQYSRPIELYKNPEIISELKHLIHPFILRRLKEDKSIIPDLPDKIESKKYSNLTQEQVTLYQSTVNIQLKLVNNSEGISRRGLILGTILKLKQICNHPAQFLKDGKLSENRSGKLKLLLELIIKIQQRNESMLIFTQYVEMAKIIKNIIQINLRQEILLFHGGLSRKRRDEMINEFQDGIGPKILVLSLKSGGIGLNLTKASQVIHYDRWWNPAVEDQATDRAYRIGQQKNVLVHKFICPGTIEEKIDEVIEKKKSLSKEILGSGEDWITSMSNKEFKELISLSRENFNHEFD